MRWEQVDHAWILYSEHRAEAAICKPREESPRWAVRLRAGDKVESVQLDPNLSLDEAKLVVQTLSGAQT